MNVGCELTAAVGMAQKVTDNGSDGAEDLHRDMPSRPDNLYKSVSIDGVYWVLFPPRATYPKDHPSGEDKAKGDDLKYNMYP